VPPQHPATGDVLDQALHVARTQAAKTPTAPAFLQALKPNSPLFAQTSRVNIARPAAQKKQQARVVPAPQDHHTLLGTNENTTATADEQSFLARQNYKDKSATAPVRQQAKTIEQAYVKGGDTRKTTPARKTKGVRGGSAGLQGAALTAPNLTVVGGRALDSLAAGIPFGSATGLAAKGINALNLPDAERQQVIGGFEKDTSLDNPAQRAALVSEALARGNIIPAHATTRQILEAALTPHQHKLSLWDIVNPENIAKDALYTPVFAAEGGYAAGHAVRAAIPKALGGKGDTTELKAIGKGELAQVEHPLATAERNPFQTGLAIASLLKFAGGAAGRAADLPQTPRLVKTPEGFTLDKGTLSKNLTERVAQKGSDALLARSPILQRHEFGKQVRTLHGRATQFGEHAAEENVKPFLDTRKGLKRTERNSLLFNQGAGGGAAPAEFAASYEDKAAAFKAAGKRALPKTQKAQANLRRAESEQFGDAPLSAKQQAYVDAGRAAAGNRTNFLIDQGALDPVSAKWRDAEHLVDLRASQGDLLARGVEKARDAWVSAEKGSPEQENASRALDHALDYFLSKHAEAGGQEPFRVPTKKVKPLTDFMRPGRAVRTNKELKSMVTGVGKQSKGGAVTSGNYPHSEAEFIRQLMQPSTAAATGKFVDDVRTKLGRPAVPGEEIPEGTVLRSDKNIRATPKVTVTAEHHLNAEAESLRSMRDQFRDPEQEDNLTHVPAGFAGTIYPRAVLDHIDDLVKRADAKHGGIAQATRAYKGAILYSRPAYAAGNFFGSMGQAVLGGTGPLSVARKNALAKPIGVNDNSFAARVFDEPKGTLGGALDNARFAPTVAGKVGQGIKGSAQAVDSVYRGSIRRASIWSDNIWRDALYTRHALPEARKLAYPDDGAIKRLLVRKRASDSAIQDAAKAMADGTTEAAAQARDRALQKTFDFLGDFAAMKRYKGLDLAVPFNAWTRFSGKLLLQTLPLKYPGRDLLLYQLGQLGQQGTAQQGVLPQYLQETIPLGGNNPDARFGLATQRANSFATLGELAPLGRNGGVSLEELLGNASPFLAPGIEAVTGKDLQTGKDVKDADGNPIHGSPSGIAKFLGSQALGLVPPASTAAKAFDIPYLSDLAKTGTSANPDAPKQPWWLGPLNQTLPARVTLRNAASDQAYGVQSLTASLVSKLSASNKKLAATPAGIAKIQRDAVALSAKITKNLAYYQAHPDEVQKLITNGGDGTARAK
jgi:hypothetical protein